MPLAEPQFVAHNHNHHHHLLTTNINHFVSDVRPCVSALRALFMLDGEARSVSKREEVSKWIAEAPNVGRERASEKKRFIDIEPAKRLPVPLSRLHCLVCGAHQWRSYNVSVCRP
jgi:hypothetical protein